MNIINSINTLTLTRCPHHLFLAEEEFYECMGSSEIEKHKIIIPIIEMSIG
jgi:hypothetical protein